MSEDISNFELLPKVVPLIVWVSESGVTMCIDIQFIITGIRIPLFALL